MYDFPTKDLPPELSVARLDAAFAGDAAGPPAGMAAYRRAARERQEPPLTAEPRILGLATIWCEAKRSYVYWDRLPGDGWWVEQCLAFLPPVRAAPTESACWGALQGFVHLLGDGHTTIYRPWRLRTATAAPTLWLTAFEGRPLVIEGEALPPGTVELRYPMVKLLD
jgi:hypothetical protein